jgi:hypothetical protein
MGQVVENMLSQCRILSLNLNTIKGGKQTNKYNLHINCM